MILQSLPTEFKSLFSLLFCTQYTLFHASIFDSDSYNLLSLTTPIIIIIIIIMIIIIIIIIIIMIIILSHTLLLNFRF